MSEYILNNGLSPFDHPFHDALFSKGHVFQVCRCLDEREIVALSQFIRKKSEWWIKYKDPEIRWEWQKELLKRTFYRMTISYVLEELEFFCQDSRKYRRQIPDRPH